MTLPVSLNSDIVCGAVVAGVGATVAAYSLQTYEIGRISEMGSGMVPLMLGCALLILGIVTALGPMLRIAVLAQVGEDGSLSDLARPAFFVLLAILSFALLVDRIGMVLSVVILTCIGRLAGGPVDVLSSAALGTVLSVLAALIFVYGLSTPIPLFW
jgi:hypothetical protein